MKQQKLSATQTRTTARKPSEVSKAIGKTATHPVLQMQADIGNQRTNARIQQQGQYKGANKPMFGGLSGELSRGNPIQAKLSIGTVGDRYEQEADRIAAEVASQLNKPSREVSPESQNGDRLEAAPPVQTKTAPSPIEATEGSAIDPELEASIQQAKGSGQPLTKTVREPMERALGTDLSGVKIHTDSQSDRLNKSLQARAFTTGKNIFFRQGEYNTESSKGRELIAHELVHVEQQTGQKSPQKADAKTIQRKDKKATAAQGTAGSGTSQADMWRIPASIVHKGKAGAVIEDSGQPQKAIAGSSGDYLFSEKGAGVKPLALIGTKKTILDFLKRKSDKGIDNQNATLPHIYMGISYYQPSERFRGLFPVQDSAQQLTEQTLGVLGEAGLIGGMSKGVEAIGEAANSGFLKDIAVPAVDIAEKMLDVKANLKSKNLTDKLGGIFGSKKQKQNGPPLICVMFDYNIPDGTVRIGKGRISFEDIAPLVEKRLSAM